MKGLTAGESGIELMPVLNGWLAKAPAEIYRATVDLARKVDQSGIERRPRLGAKARQLLDIALDLRRERLDLALQGRRLPQLRRLDAGRGDLALGQPLLPPTVLAHEVLDAATDERQGPVRALDGEGPRHGWMVVWRGRAGQAGVYCALRTELHFAPRTYCARATPHGCRTALAPSRCASGRIAFGVPLL